MKFREALERAHRYSESRPFAFGAAYWTTLGLILAVLFYGLNQSTAAVAGAFGLVSIALIAVIVLVSILGVSVYIWLYVTNPYRYHPSPELDLFYSIRLFALLGFGVIALVAVLVFQIAGPD